MSGERDVNFPATFTMHAPNGPTHACVKHARAIEAIFRMLGAHVGSTKAPDDSQCDNCVNEAKAAARRKA